MDNSLHVLFFLSHTPACVLPLHQEDVDEEKVDQQTDKAGQSFQDLMQGLTLDEQQQKNVSVPFCFICLLHLANEKNLALETRTQNLADFVIRT